jgi:hypothetical protein
MMSAQRVSVSWGLNSRPFPSTGVQAQAQLAHPRAFNEEDRSFRPHIVRAADVITHAAYRSAGNALRNLPRVPSQELLEQGIAFRGIEQRWFIRAFYPRPSRRL